MPRYRFAKLDAFAEGGSTGNPAGAVYLSRPEELSPEQMLRIGRECAGWVSEVGFIAPLGDGAAGSTAARAVEPAPGYWIRYWSAAREVDFCGHATVAILHDLLKNDPAARGSASVTIHTKNDTLVVENRIESDDAVYVTAPPGVPGKLRAGSAEIASALHTAGGSVRGAAVVNAGLDTLIVEMASLESVLEMTPPQEELKRFTEKIGVDIVHVWSREVSKPQSAYRARVFAPRFGYLEDPATGSGNAAFGFHLLGSGAWDGSPIVIEQNGSRENPNKVRLSAVTRGGEKRVMFGGGAVVRVRGDYIL